VGYECPLTHAENWAREQAGLATLPPSGFIDHHLVGTVYPADAEVQVQVLVGLIVLVSWVAFLALGRRRRRRRSHRAGGAAA